MTDLPHEHETAEETARRKRLALIASKGTLDQAYPPLILAATAASLGWEVGIYFTFYGLDILHKDRFDKLKVAPLANPSGPFQVPSLVGVIPGATTAATTMLKKWMKNANMPTIAEFIEMNQALNVTFFACSTSMGIMGVQESDLIDGCNVAGAAAFLDFAADADIQLFV
ncbi:MAG: peroxiredoxin family protein [Actinobacteria bacterium]|nr:peroxiredoxin family protein [Actinomycetota bacterium]